MTEEMVENIPPTADHYTDFIKMIKTASIKTIPSGYSTT
jgi:hypothetical protein